LVVDIGHTQCSIVPVRAHRAAIVSMRVDSYVLC
jgi:hypothetical protein